MIPQDHLLRRIDSKIDFDFIYEITERLYCPDNGRPSIDPVLFFRMQLISYLYGMKSDRELCREVHLNLAYRWFCRLRLTDSVPDHSSMTRIWGRFGETGFAEIFGCLLKGWKVSGDIRGKRVIADASLVEANASIDSLQEREEGDPQARELKICDQRYHDIREGKRDRRVANQAHVSKTDPDAMLVSRKNGPRKLKYKVVMTQ